MRVLLFGANGQVGTEIRRRAGGDVAIVALDRARCDLSQAGAAARAIEREACDAVVNAAAYTAVDRAESEPDLAGRINAEAPREMAEAAAAKRVPLIHLSTDYVFDGTASRPYREDDPVAPLGVYGATKLKGEEAVAAGGGAYAILRLSWVFSAHGSNFVKTMLRLARERPALRVVADQRGKPTPAADAAEAALLVARALLADPARSGLYHFAGDAPASWADFAEAIMAEAGLAVPVERIATADFPTPARRPAWSVLDTAKFERVFARPAPSWRAGLESVVAELGAPEKEEGR
ncbi:dTDP-4-dehydrorhamnose reductase [Amphiplicatus metriothermophilus]|uniref:dTDP-4-dehydrorhamnose reductase n=1 Tax=Amphiplicatus metriothermophilus TaxID=1519374 RepID=A0A239PKW9_9PROT|nr:dTDP-4-dehydrorhamnose reductase [Amphiplicatus metriothermophilus]MBB5517218.1 dTDP-4-dehydrorhamnose reductase [Amphiplicatus metriothermophilus]SNT68446.1 dTDP-4-dehydrorhamnose reductase [Amphiplicatus metriothermophilus]